MKKTRWLAIIAASLLITGCGNDDDDSNNNTDTGADVGPDVEPDADEPDVDEPDANEPDTDTDEPDADTGPLPCEHVWDEIPHTEPADLSTPNGIDPSSELTAGTAMGGRVLQGQHFFDGLYADCRVGDFVLTNEHIRICIADERPVSHLLFTGGHVVDMEPVDSPGNDAIIAILPSTELLSATGDLVELIRDGSDGGATVVRVEGIDVTTRAVANVVGQLLTPKKLEFITEYRLNPGSTALEVVTWVRGAEGSRRTAVLSDLVLSGDTSIPYWENLGFVAPEEDETFSIFSQFAPNRSYAVYAEGMENISLDLGGYDVPVTGLQFEKGIICPDEEAVFQRYYAVGNGDLPSLHQQLEEVADYTNISQDFHVTGMSGVETPRFAVNDSNGNTISFIQLDNGDTNSMVPEGDFQLVSIDWQADPVSVTFPTDGAIEIAAPPLGRLSINVTEDELPLSARIDVEGPVTETHFAMNGNAEIYLPPGSYEVTVLRGEEYSAQSETVEITEGMEASFDATLIREMDTFGWVSGDMHQHSTPSVDSVIALTDRAAANITTGLDFLSPTDHDSLGDFRTALDTIDGADEILLFQGIETSPIYGHFNMFPFEYDRQLPAHGAPPLSVREDNEMARTVEMVPFLDLVQADIDAGARILQMNHPRGTQGLFNYAEYDPISGPEETIPSKWYDDFDSVEIINDIGEICEVTRDWFGLLSRGYRITGVGNSDTHYLTNASGYPRNYLYIGENGEDEADLDEDAIVSAIQEMNVSVSGGLFITYQDYLPGDVVSIDSGETFSLHTLIQSPSWIAAEEIVVFVNGVETDRITLTESSEELVDFDDALSFGLTEDSYIVLFAWSSTRGTLEHRNQPISFINPIFVDIDGDGWTPPGVTDETGEHFIPEVTGFDFCD